MTSRATTANKGLDLSGKFACVSGGTHGIGAAIAIRLAQGGASVIIVGRNEAAAQQVLKDVRSSAKAGTTHHFIKTDLSLVSGIRQTADEIVKKVPQGIDYLFETAGRPPIDPFTLTDEGYEKSFALQILGRFGLPYLLLAKNKLKESLTIVCAAGTGMGDLEIDDLELRRDDNRNFTIMKRASRDAIVVDAFSQEFARRFPFLRVSHMFPGLVSSKMQDLPFGMHYVYAFVGPLIALTIGHSPSQTAEGAIYLGCHPASQLSDPQVPRIFSPWIGQWQPSKFARSPTHCAKIYDKLVEYFQ